MSLEKHAGSTGPFSASNLTTSPYPSPPSRATFLADQVEVMLAEQYTTVGAPVEAAAARPPPTLPPKPPPLLPPT